MRAKGFLVIGVQTPLLHMSYHADNFHHLIGAIDVQAPADGICIAEKLARQSIVNHRHLLRPLVIAACEKSAAFEGNAHHLQIIWLHNVVQRPIHVVLARWFWLAVDPEQPFVIRSERKRAP